MSVGIKIKRLREQNNITQPELAYRLGISQGTLCNIESGETKKIDIAVISKICKEFNVDFEYFLDETQVNNVKTNNGAIAYRIDNVNNFPDNLVEQIKFLVEESKRKDLEIERLKAWLKK